MIIKHDEVIKDLKKIFYDCEINDMERIAEHRNMWEFIYRKLLFNTFLIV